MYFWSYLPRCILRYSRCARLSYIKKARGDLTHSSGVTRRPSLIRSFKITCVFETSEYPLATHDSHKGIIANFHAAGTWAIDRFHIFQHWQRQFREGIQITMLDEQIIWRNFLTPSPEGYSKPPFNSSNQHIWTTTIAQIGHQDPRLPSLSTYLGLFVCLLLFLLALVIVMLYRMKHTIAPLPSDMESAGHTEMFPDVELTEPTQV